MNTYEEKGFLSHLDVLNLELYAMHDEIQEADRAYDLSKHYRTKANVLYQSVDRFSRSSRVLDIVCSVLNTKHVHCWDSMVWVKRPGEAKAVSPHQDGTYWTYTNKHKALTMWVPLQRVDASNGSIEYAEGSHILGQRKHVDKPSPGNLLVRGQTVEDDLHFNDPLVMPFGMASIHHPYMVHRSATNCVDATRYALNFMFVSYDCKPLFDEPREYTMPICGAQDPAWLASPQPGKDRDANEVAWRLAHAAQRSNYLRMNNDV